MFWQGGALSDFQIGAFDMDAFQEGATNLNTWEYFGDRWHRADYTDPNSEWIPGYFPAVRDFTSVTINRLDVYKRQVRNQLIDWERTKKDTSSIEEEERSFKLSVSVEESLSLIHI